MPPIQRIALHVKLITLICFLSQTMNWVKSADRLQAKGSIFSTGARRRQWLLSGEQHLVAYLDWMQSLRANVHSVKCSCFWSWPASCTSDSDWFFVFRVTAHCALCCFGVKSWLATGAQCELWRSKSWPVLNLMHWNSSGAAAWPQAVPLQRCKWCDHSLKTNTKIRKEK